MGRAMEKEVTPHVAAIDAGLRDTVSPAEWAAMEATLEKIAAAAAARSREAA